MSRGRSRNTGAQRRRESGDLALRPGSWLLALGALPVPVPLALWDGRTVPSAVPTLVPRLVPTLVLAGVERCVMLVASNAPRAWTKQILSD